MSKTKKHVSLMLALLMIFSAFAGILLLTPTKAQPTMAFTETLNNIHVGDTQAIGALTPTGGTSTYTVASSAIAPGTGSGVTVADGAGVVTLTNVAATAAGTYTISADVTDSAGTPVTESVTKSFTVYASVVAPTVTAPAATVAGSVTLTAAAATGGSGTYTYQWKKDGTNVAGATGLTLTDDAFTATAVYTIEATDDSGSTQAAAKATSAPHTVNLATAATIAGPTTIPSNIADFDLDATTAGMSSYLWEDGSTAAVRTVTTAGTYSFTANDGAADYRTGSITVTAGGAVTIAGPTIAEATDPVTLTASGATSYVWGGGQTTAKITDTPASLPIIYSLDEFVFNGDTFTDGVNATFGVAQAHTVTAGAYTSLVAPTVTGSATGKMGQAMTLTATGVTGGNGYDYEYQWFVNGDAVAGATDATYTFTPLMPDFLPNANTVTVVVSSPVGSVADVETDFDLTLDIEIYTMTQINDTTFKVDVDFSKFLGAAMDQTMLVEGVDMDATSGSTIITLKDSYYNNLAAGKHELVTLFDDGASLFEFEKTAKAAGAGTGDSNTMVYVLIASMIACGVVALAVLDKRRKAKNN